MRKLIVVVVGCGFVLLTLINQSQSKVIPCVISNDIIECMVLPQDVTYLKQGQIVYFQVGKNNYQASIESIGHEPVVDTHILYPVVMKSLEYQNSFRNFPIRVIYYHKTTNWIVYLLSKIVV